MSFVSVLLPLIELLRFGACSHLVSLLLNVGLDDLENVIPIVDGKLGHNILSCLGNLHDLAPLVDLLVHVVLLGQAPRSRGSWWRRGRWRRRTPRRRGDGGGGSKLLVNLVLDTSFTSFA